MSLTEKLGGTAKESPSLSPEGGVYLLGLGSCPSAEVDQRYPGPTRHAQPETVKSSYGG